MRCARRNSDDETELGRTRREARTFTNKHGRNRDACEGDIGRKTARIARNPFHTVGTALGEIFGERACHAMDENFSGKKLITKFKRIERGFLSFRADQGRVGNY
jgi:hypothetical protein